MKRFLLTAALLATTLGFGSGAFALSPEGMRSRTGFVTDSDVISPQTTHTFRYSHVANRLGEVRVKSYGSTVLRVEVLDGVGNIVASGTDRFDNTIVLNWVPLWTQVYTIRVINFADVSNIYDFQMN